MRRRLAALALAAVAAIAAAAPADAQTPAAFYAGKTVQIVVGFTAGGSYDFYARFLAEFWGKRIPGEPTVIVQNRPGAGSRNAAAYVFNVAPKDGTVIALTNNMLPLFQYLQPGAARYDLTRAHWIGNMVELNSVVAVWHTAPARTIADMKRIEITLGSTGRGGETYIVPAMMNAVLGTKYKIVTGYPGINEIMLAIERGELAGRSASWANIVQQRPDWVSEKKIHAVVQIGTTKDPALPALPLLADLASNAEERQLLELVSGFPVLSRAPWVAPEVPADRVEALRRAFDATLRDADVLRFARERAIDISPNPGEAVQKIVGQHAAMPADLVAKARDILKLGDETN